MTWITNSFSYPFSVVASSTGCLFTIIVRFTLLLGVRIFVTSQCGSMSSRYVYLALFCPFIPLSSISGQNKDELFPVRSKTDFFANPTLQQVNPNCQRTLTIQSFCFIQTTCSRSCRSWYFIVIFSAPKNSPSDLLSVSGYHFLSVSPQRVHETDLLWLFP